MANPSEATRTGSEDNRQTPRPSGSAGWGAVRSALKQVAHRHPALLDAARTARAWLFPRKIKPRTLLPGYEPLCIDEDKLAELARISPVLGDEILAEFAALSKALDGHAADMRENRWWFEHPLDNLPAAAAELNVVYSMPKVGGSTLGATLARRGLVYSSHQLGAKGLAFLDQNIRQSAARPVICSGWRTARVDAAWLRVLIAVNRALRTTRHPLDVPVRKPFVVTGVREPIALLLSLIFHGWEIYVDAPEMLTSAVAHRCLADDPWQLCGADWFANEQREVFGIDVYARPFPVERGWDIIENDAARVLVIRQENFSSLADALSAMFGWDRSTLQIVNANVAAEKAYAPYYDAIRKTIRFSKAELDTFYSQPYVRHFYTPAEIKQFEKRWLAAPGDAAAEPPVPRRAA